MRTEGTSILAALAIHAGVLLVARAMPPLADLVERTRRPLDTIDIVDIEPTKPAAVAAREPAPQPDTPAPQPVEPDRASPQAEARVARVDAPAAANTPPPDQTPEPAPTQKKPTQFDELPPDQGGILAVPGVPGIGTPVWQVPGGMPAAGGPPPPAPTVAPAPRPIDRQAGTRILNAELAKKDKDLGLDLPVAGSMKSAVSRAVMGTDLPAGTKGSIECRVSAGGRVSGCRLVGSNGGSAGSWNAAVSAAGAIAGGPLPERYAGGAVVTIDVSIVDTPPAGSKGGFTGTGASFDISNVGAHAQRQVRAVHRVVAAR